MPRRNNRTEFERRLALLTNGDRSLSTATEILVRAMRGSYDDSAGRETFNEFLGRVVDRLDKRRNRRDNSWLS